MLKTKRLLLRPFEKSDIDDLIPLFQDREVMEFSNGIKSREEIHSWIQKQIENYSINDGVALLAVETLSTSEVIGYCGLSQFPDIDGQAEIEIGYRLRRKFWGMGYATEATTAIRDHAFTKLNQSRLVALIDPSNIRSINVAEKLVMKFEKEVMMQGYSHPDHLYVISKKVD